MAKLIMTVEEMKDRAAWLKVRNTGIGGSDASVVVGMNKWKSPFQLWMEKTGQKEPDDLSDNEAVYWGTVLESAVANRFSEVTGKKVCKRGLMQSEEYPWMLASIDRDVIGENAGLECKTGDIRTKAYWEDEDIPDAYYIQCQHYMAVTGAERWYIAALLGGNRFVWKTVERNEDDIKAIVEAEKDFWGMVQTNTMPKVDGSESCKKALADRFSHVKQEETELPQEAEEILTKIDNMQEAVDDLTLSIDEQKNRLREMLGEFEIGRIGERKVSWKQQAGRASIDSKKLKEEHPMIYAKYLKTGKPYRVLRIS